MWKRMIWLFAIATAMLPAQIPADAPAFTSDETAIYRDFLLHYPEQLSNMIGMQDTTVAFAMPDILKPIKIAPNFVIPTYSGRKLPPGIMALTDEKAVTARIAAKGKLVDPARRGPGTGPDGYVRTHLTLSEIVRSNASAGGLHLLCALRMHGRTGRFGLLYAKARPMEA